MSYNVHQLMSTESNNLFTLCMFNRKYLIRKTTFYYLSSVTYDLLNISTIIVKKSSTHFEA